jgi:DNA-binding beta-propeller fold protein YncE
MDERLLRALLERAVADEPPAGHLVHRSVAAGLRLRRRRRVRAAVAYVSIAAVIVAAAVAVPALRTGSGPAPATGPSIPATLYVAASTPSDSAGSVTPISAATGTVRLPIATGQIDSLISTPDGRTVFIASKSSGSVRAISTTTGTVGPPIGVKPEPAAMAITPDGKTLYVASVGNYHGPGWVTPISVATGQAEPPI